jgi:hypothetical protein
MYGVGKLFVKLAAKLDETIGGHAHSVHQRKL